MELSATGWDIDVDDETQVFVNGKSHGFLNKGTSNNVYSPRNIFILRKSNLIIGDNLIEFVQRQPATGWTGIQDEKWAVKDLRVDITNFGSLIPSINLLLDDK